MWQLVQHPITKAEFKAGKLKGDETIIFNYNDTILNYFKLDNTIQKLNSYSRILRYDPSDKITALNLMIERMNQAVHLLNEGVNMYNQYINIVNEAKILKQPNILNTQQKSLINLTANITAISSTDHATY